MYSLFTIPKKVSSNRTQREGSWGVGMALAGVAVITALARTLMPPSLHDQPPVEQFFPLAGKSRLTDLLEEINTQVRMLSKLKICIILSHWIMAGVTIPQNPKIELED